MRSPFVVVIRFSASFAEISRQLSEALGVEFRSLAPIDVNAMPRAGAVVLLSAGGAERDAIEWLESRELQPDVPLFVAGSDTSRRTAARAVARGARDYFALPEDVELLHHALEAAVAQQAGQGVEDRADTDLTAFNPIAGENDAVRSTIARAAHLMRHVRGSGLIVGEDGTGKELLARCIHAGSARRSEPFVPVSCSALPRPVIESELFGCERDVMPDAYAARPGLFEIADGGTLFLDEVETLPLNIQDRLFRFLEDHEVRRLGSSRARRVDLRVLVATTANLEAAVRAGTFRKDLLLRLSAVTLELPPLRARGSDVVLIAERVLQSLAALHQVPMPELRADTRQVLAEYSWPGNIRELKQSLERALLLSPMGSLRLTELARPQQEFAGWTSSIPFPAELDQITSAAARATLEACGGNVSQAARQLAVSRGRLRRLIRLSPPPGTIRQSSVAEELSPPN